MEELKTMLILIWQIQIHLCNNYKIMYKTSHKCSYKIYIFYKNVTLQLRAKSIDYFVIKILNIN